MPNLIIHYPSVPERAVVAIASDKYEFDFEWSSDATGALVVREDSKVRAVIPLPGPTLIEVVDDDGEP